MNISESAGELFSSFGSVLPPHFFSLVWRTQFRINSWNLMIILCPTFDSEGQGVQEMLPVSAIFVRHHLCSGTLDRYESNGNQHCIIIPWFLTCEFPLPQRREKTKPDQANKNLWSIFVSLRIRKSRNRFFKARREHFMGGPMGLKNDHNHYLLMVSKQSLGDGVRVKHH